MRKILFRGKRTDTGEWVYGSYIPKWYDGIRISAVIIVDRNSEDLGLLDDRLVKYYVKRETVEQWTGEIDIDKVRIFEGDICKGVEDIIAPVYFQDSMYCWGAYVLCLQWGDDCTLKVIGNIHDNPELLEEL